MIQAFCGVRRKHERRSAGQVDLDHLHERKTPAFNVSLADAVESIRRVRRLAWRRDATIVAGHDPDQWPTIRKAPEFYD